MFSILLFEFFGTGIFAGTVNIIDPLPVATTPDVNQYYLIYICLMYMAVLLICTPISGGHLNPAVTVGVWLTCDDKKAKIGKMLYMVFAQVLGGFLGLAIGRMVRVKLTSGTPLVPASYNPAYNYAVSPVQTVQTTLP